MNPTNPTKNDLAMIQDLFYERMSQLTRNANLKPSKVTIMTSPQNNVRAAAIAGRSSSAIGRC